MSSIKENFKNGFAVDKLIYPNKLSYILSWVLLAAGVVTGIYGALIGEIAIMGVSLMVIYTTVAIECIHARNYIRKNMKKE